MAYYLDASAWVKRYIQESGSECINRFWQTRPAVACASLGIIEVVSAVSRRLALAGSASDVHERTVSAVHIDSHGIASIPLNETVFRMALDLAAARRLRGADSVHLAAALYLREQVNGPVALIACDRELLDAAAATGLLAADPTQTHDIRQA